MIPSLTLFVHVVGMLTLFVGLGLEWASLDGLQRSITREQALPWLRLVVMVPRVSGIAVAAIVVSGFYLGARVGVLGNDWMRATYGALFLMAIVSGPVSRSPMRALKRVADVPAEELWLCGQRRPIRFCGCLYAFASPLAWQLCFS